jgi:hypothetical protein
VTLDRCDVLTVKGSHESAERISSFALTNSFRGIWREDDIRSDQQAERTASKAHLTAITCRQATRLNTVIEARRRMWRTLRTGCGEVVGGARAFVPVPPIALGMLVGPAVGAIFGSIRSCAAPSERLARGVLGTRRAPEGVAPVRPEIVPRDRDVADVPSRCGALRELEAAITLHGPFIDLEANQRTQRK